MVPDFGILPLYLQNKSKNISKQQNLSSIFLHYTGQITIIPKPELRGFGGDSLTKPPFGVTSAEVVIICPDYRFVFFPGFVMLQ